MDAEIVEHVLTMAVPLTTPKMARGDGEHESGGDGHHLQKDHQGAEDSVAGCAKTLKILDHHPDRLHGTAGRGPLLRKVEENRRAGNLNPLGDDCRRGECACSRNPACGFGPNLVFLMMRPIPSRQ